MLLKRVGRENKERLLVVYCLPKVPLSTQVGETIGNFFIIKRFLMFNETRKKQLNTVIHCSIKCYSSLTKQNENSHRSTRTSFFSFPQPLRAFSVYFSLLSNLPTTQKGLCGEESSMRILFVSYDKILTFSFTMSFYFRY